MKLLYLISALPLAFSKPQSDPSSLPVVGGAGAYQGYLDTLADDDSDQESTTSSDASSKTHSKPSWNTASPGDIKISCPEIFEDNHNGKVIEIADLIDCIQDLYTDGQQIKRGKFPKRMKEKINLLSVKNTMKYIDELEDEDTDESDFSE